MEAQVRVERAHELGVLLSVGQRSEGPVGELADVALGSSQHERVRPEVLEHRDGAVAAHGAADDDRLLRLEESEVRTGRAALRATDARGKPIVFGRARETNAERLRVGARVDRGRELAQRGDDAGARPHHPRVGNELGDRHAEACGDHGITRRERDREVLGRSVHRALLPN